MWTNKKGEQVHPDIVPHEEKLKTELVYKLLDEAIDVQDALMAFKKIVLSHIDAYMEMMREKYGINPVKGTKGNVSLESFDGLKKVMVQVSTLISFDEKLGFAKEKLDEYFVEKTEHADAEIKTLITKVFDVDKKGNVNAKQILSLKSYKIQHPKWLEAMAIIDDAIEIVGTKSYIRFYRRQNIADKLENISIDFAAL